MQTVKRGDTFALSGRAEWPGVTDFRGYRVRCQIRTAQDAMIHDFGTTRVQPDGLYYFATNETATWPAFDPRNQQMTMAYLDVELTAPTGERRSTPTIMLKIERDIAHD